VQYSTIAIVLHWAIARMAIGRMAIGRMG